MILRTEIVPVRAPHLHWCFATCSKHIFIALVTQDLNGGVPQPWCFMFLIVISKAHNRVVNAARKCGLLLISFISRNRVEQ